MNFNPVNNDQSILLNLRNNHQNYKLYIRTYESPYFYLSNTITANNITYTVSGRIRENTFGNGNRVHFNAGALTEVPISRIPIMDLRIERAMNIFGL